MAGIPYNPHGTVVTVDSVQVEGVRDIQIGGGQTGEADTTDSDSGGSRSFVRGLGDNGQMTLDLVHYPAEAGQANLRTLKASGTVVAVVVTLPALATDDATTATITFNAFVQDFTWSLPTAEDEIGSAVATLRVVSDPVEAAA